MASLNAQSRPPRRSGDDGAVRVETPSGNIADLLEQLRDSVFAVLQRHGVSLHDARQLVYQPVLPESNSEGPICLTVQLKQPMTGEVVAVWEDERHLAVNLYAVAFHFSMTPQQPVLPFSVGQPVAPPERESPAITTIPSTTDPQLSMRLAEAGMISQQQLMEGLGVSPELLRPLAETSSSEQGTTCKSGSTATDKPSSNYHREERAIDL